MHKNSRLIDDFDNLKDLKKKKTEFVSITGT